MIFAAFYTYYVVFLGFGKIIMAEKNVHKMFVKSIDFWFWKFSFQTFRRQLIRHQVFWYLTEAGTSSEEAGTRRSWRRRRNCPTSSQNGKKELTSTTDGRCSSTAVFRFQLCFPEFSFKQNSLSCYKRPICNNTQT